MEARTRLSFVIFQEGRYWVAQCLEYDITTQAKNWAEMPRAIECAILGHIIVSIEIGTEPFESLPRAPKEFLDAFEVGIPVSDAEERRAPLPIPKKLRPKYPLHEKHFRVGNMATAYQ